MAEYFLRDEATRRGLAIDVRSTGTHAWNGRAATVDGRKVMANFGVPIDDHRTMELDDRLVEWADLLICMAREHEREVARTFPEAVPRTFTLKGFLELLPALPTYEETGSWLDAAAGMRDVAEAISDIDVDDPFGEREAAYRRVATEIKGLVERLAEGLERKRAGCRE